MPTTTTQQSNLAACLFPLNSAGAGHEIQIFPAGQFDAPDGALSGKGTWILNADIANKLIAATGTKQNILIDYDHQSLLFTKNLEPLESAGTFAGANLEWREGVGLFATNVHWTAASKAHFAKDKYRFISPLFTYDANTGEVTRLISVALTDNPAIKNMQAIELAAASLLKQQDKAKLTGNDETNAIIAAASAYQLAEQKAGRQVSVANAVYHVTKGKSKEPDPVLDDTSAIIAAASAYQLAEKKAGREVSVAGAVSYVTNKG